METDRRMRKHWIFMWSLAELQGKDGVQTEKTYLRNVAVKGEIRERTV